MNAVALAILGVVLLTLQTTVAPASTIWGAKPDWLLMLVVFLGLYARPTQAVIASGVLGLCADLLTLERLGLLAATYTLLAWAVVAVRDFMFRFRLTTQFAVTFVSAVLAHAGWLVYRRMLHGPGESMVREVAVGVLLSSLYTAALAPILHRGLLRAGRLIGIRRPRYAFRDDALS